MNGLVTGAELCPAALLTPASCPEPPANRRHDTAARVYESGYFSPSERFIGCASVLKITELKSSVEGGANSR
jgi:hypothetical protein